MINTVVVAGPTASGKTRLSIDLAKRIDGEIIAADSRTVYKEMNIGTAKPGADEREGIVHHLIDVASISDDFSVADFAELAKAAQEDILSRGKKVVITGGSGMYVDALVYGFSFRSKNEVEAKKYSQMSLEKLQQLTREKGLKLNESDFGNSRRLVRALVSGEVGSGDKELPPEVLYISLSPDPDLLAERIAARTDDWLESGLVEEARKLYREYGQAEPLNTTPYKEVELLLKGKIDALQCKDLINLHLRQLAKRQLTWFKRNPDIKWVRSPEEGLEIATKAVAGV